MARQLGSVCFFGCSLALPGLTFSLADLCRQALYHSLLSMMPIWEIFQTLNCRCQLPSLHTSGEHLDPSHLWIVWWDGKIVLLSMPRKDLTLPQKWWTLLSSENYVLGYLPGDALSAGFSSLLMYRHCSGVPFSLIYWTLLARKTWKHFALFLIYPRTTWLEHKRSGSVFNHTQSQHPSGTITSNMFHTLKKCSTKFDKPCLNIQSDSLKAKLFT